MTPSVQRNEGLERVAAGMVAAASIGSCMAGTLGLLAQCDSARDAGAAALWLGLHVVLAWRAHLPTELDGRPGGASRAPGPWRQVGWTVVQVLVLSALVGAVGTPLAFLPAILIWLQVTLLRIADRDALAAFAMAVAATQAWFAVQIAPGPATGLLLLFTGLAALIGLALVDSRATRRLPRRLPRGARSSGTESRTQVWRHVASAAALGSIVLFATLLLRGLGGQVADWVVGDPVDSARSRLAAGASASTGGVETRTRAARRLSERVGYGGSLGDLGEDVVVEVWVSKEGQPPSQVAPSLHLAALHLDTFTDEGIRSTVGAELVRDDDDGREDDWVELRPERAFDREILVRAVPIAVGSGARAPLMHVDPLVAVKLPQVRYHPRGLLTTAGAAEEVLTYLMRSARPADPLQALQPGGPAAGSDRHARQLPAESAALEYLRARALGVVGDARTDGEKVRRVLAHFRRGYRYSFIGSELEGLDGLVDFVRRREGFCTAFATTATLFLRLVDVPARLVTGYHLDEFDPDRGSYIGRDNDAHAWFEVQFEGLGWVSFDPTPPAEVDAARAGEQREPGVGDWLAAIGDDFAAWREGGNFGDVIERLGALPGAVLASIGAAGLAAAVALVALLILVARLLWRARSTARGARRAEEGEAEVTTPEDWYRILLAHLSRLGHPRSAGSTPREHARRLTANGFDEAEAVDHSVDLLYRERFAALALEREERSALAALIDRLRARSPGEPR
ncbi:transglutaminase domain-containing protein [Engelhardtia mirabilis]|uniref:Protein-glutamine gamma-glutamyltransferase n=1 Tax=Engelhardtia mirabilis TaxID=2528011 RepID=A0A518BEX1_9BACT|nr:Protein-glutamine gamma-glutamyltransferase [Planctomycetes bacterium Pla133]QDU99864.1 Protein-glutamine gamma-glutamyltransferase [Planctomycetes bacterium Pla86]